MSMGKSKGGWRKLFVGLLGCFTVNAETTLVPRFPQGVYVNIGNDIPGSGATDASVAVTSICSPGALKAQAIMSHNSQRRVDGGPVRGPSKESF
jgi:hypothetical protein